MCGKVVWHMALLHCSALLLLLIKTHFIYTKWAFKILENADPV